MRALVVYESMYGNTHRIAEAIARGLRSAYAVQVVSVAGARFEDVGRYHLIVAGGPTHAHGMSRSDTREAPISAPRVKADQLQVEPDAGGLSLRVWLDTLGLRSGHLAAFDTRLQGYAVVTGRASKGIAAMLRQHGFQLRGAGRALGCHSGRETAKAGRGSLSGLIIWPPCPEGLSTRRERRMDLARVNRMGQR